MVINDKYMGVSVILGLRASYNHIKFKVIYMPTWNCNKLSKYRTFQQGMNKKILAFLQSKLQSHQDIKVTEPQGFVTTGLVNFWSDMRFS